MSTLSLKAISSKKILTISPHASVRDAEKMMRENRVRHLPVTNPKGDLIGILSQRDVNWVPAKKDLKVGQFMTQPVESIRESASVREAVFKILEMKISSLVVVDDQDEVVGIVTTDDLLYHLAQQLDQKKGWLESLRSFLDIRVAGEIANELATVGF